MASDPQKAMKAMKRVLEAVISSMAEDGTQPLEALLGTLEGARAAVVMLAQSGMEAGVPATDLMTLMETAMTAMQKDAMRDIAAATAAAPISVPLVQGVH